MDKIRVDSDEPPSSSKEPPGVYKGPSVSGGISTSRCNRSTYRLLLGNIRGKGLLFNRGVSLLYLYNALDREYINLL